MLDINLIRENPLKVKEALAKKLWETDFTELLKWDEERKEKLKFVETNKAEMNRLSASVPAAKKAGEDVSKIFAKVKEIAAKNKESEEKVKILEEKIHNFLAELPNIPDEDLVGGGKENNEVIKSVNAKPEFSFKLKDHVELATSLGLVDYERGGKIAGRGSWCYTNLGARLEWALVNFFISEHLGDSYEFILPPHTLNEESGYVAGQFPKFKEDVFWLDGL
jgi:seryl-tRNA synthetase